MDNVLLIMGVISFLLSVFGRLFRVSDVDSWGIFITSQIYICTFNILTRLPQ